MKNSSKFLFVCFLLTTNYLLPTTTYAQTVDELRSNIDAHTEQIKKLDSEIKQYQVQINAVGKEADTLSNAIKILDINQKKINAEISKTETSISKVNLSLNELSKEITTTEQKIDLGHNAMAESLREVAKLDDISMAEIMLGNSTMGEALEQYQISNSLNQKITDHRIELSDYKTEVEDKKSETEKQKEQLVKLTAELKDQNTILANNKKDKNNLLAETKNKETAYKSILADRQAKKAQFEKELFDFESKLKIAIDPKNLPSGRKGVLSWPLDSIRITQAFGRTVDSARLYVSGTHNGVDFGAARGTPVKAVLDGVVQATGNTDAQAGCYSYGKWVLIKHGNGLTSLYGHLDLIKVSPGQSVATSEIIGYSGATGYATGPHLHLTIYASEGVRVERYTSSKNCKGVDIPIAPANAYLDPLVYLPGL